VSILAAFFICVIGKHMNDNISGSKLKTDEISQIVRILSQRLTEPSYKYPSVQWVSEYSLIKLLVQVRNELQLSANLSGKYLLKALVESSLATRKIINDVPQGKNPHVVYCLEFGGVPEISSEELLLTTQSDFLKTVICYFSAICHHELTTQIPAYHHIARLKNMGKRSREEHLKVLSLKQEGVGNSLNVKPSLGTLLFTYDGTLYYQTTRDQTLVPGVQEVQFSPTLLARVTTLEQTLLDTLHNPWSCGGPAVVFEAWQNGVPLIDDSLFNEYLCKIGRVDFDLRVGYMLEQFEYDYCSEGLAKRFVNAKKLIKQRNLPLLPLLPKVPGQNKNMEWGLLV
jgi:predicted transcriptional regulator of viral defense system